MGKLILTTTFVMTVTTAAFAEGDPVAGERAFAQCKACHTVDQGGRSTVGPNLWDVMNRGVGQLDGFRYSRGFEAFAAENPMWTPELMDQWLENSRDAVKGTRMNYRNRDAQARADITAYLQTLTD